MSLITGKKAGLKNSLKKKRAFGEFVEAEATQPKKTVTKPLTHKKRKVEPKKESASSYEDLGTMDTWDWSEITPGHSGLLTDDLGGFLCLEEIDDVEVYYEGDDATGKIAKFRRAKSTNRKVGRKANPTEPLKEEEMKNYYDVDTFDDAIAEKEQEGVEETVATVESSEDDISMEDTPEENTPAKNKTSNKLSFKERIQQKKQEKLDKLKKQILKLEASMTTGQSDSEEQEQEQVEGEEEENPKKEKTEAEKAERKAAKMERFRAKKLEMEENKTKAENEKELKTPTKTRPTVDEIDPSVDVSAWNVLDLPQSIMDALRYNKFTHPTPIQEKVLPVALQGRHIIGAAETGSGKTLAFGIPIVRHILNHKNKHGLGALILTPTRELAIQVKNHIQNIAVFTSLRVEVIVGGMSVQKQQRVLKTMPDVVVATPGRFWEIFSENDEYLSMLKHIQFLVLDEADRMLERGHFAELTNILNAISSKRKDTTEWPEEMGEKPVAKPTDHGLHQTFVFTATLNKDLRFNVKSKSSKKNNAGSMEDLLHRLELTNKDPAVIDMTTDNIVASRLVEAKIDCVKDEKDLYVYYFVTRYPGRTIIFVNSIDALRRLVPAFRLLGVEVLSLHAQMQQKQRLKNLDRFKSNNKAVLIASDVAARGLDIPMVDHVIHYQLPRSGEIYVHRSGRTARANHEGVSLLLCGPEEQKVYTKLCHTLKKGKHYPNFPVDLSVLKEMRQRVQLATEIDKLEHQENKATHEENWMRNMARDMDLVFDDEVVKGRGNNTDTKREQEKKKHKVNSMKNELRQLLLVPMLPNGVSRKYVTGSGLSELVDRLIKNEDTSLLPAHESSKASEDIQSANKKSKQP
ncbi:P-loop containing nucleoside triphosphate hydrolase protein [Spinellus fusiger]|nr:P-loop containing nucleoside triphosphate hydrolase protein [Spinellus fusiger]